MNKKIITTIAATTTLMVAVFVGVRIYEYYSWMPIVERNQLFIEAWGSYDHENFSDYPGRVEQYISGDLYRTYFEDELSLALREGRMVSNEYSVLTTAGKTQEKSKSKNKYTMETVLTETVESKAENYTKEKSIITVWDYSNKEAPKVVEVKYQ